MSKNAQEEARKAAAQGIDFTQDAGGGFEGMNGSDLAIPFLVILQDKSPQCNERNEKHVEGAKAGMLMNTLTGELFDGEEGVDFIPCVYQKAYVEWKPRSIGGGFVAAHVNADIMLTPGMKKDDKGKDLLPNGNLIVPTAYHIGLLAKSLTKIMVAMSSSQLKVSRKWNTVMSEIVLKDKDGQPLIDAKTGRKLIAPTYSRIYNLSTKLERKNQDEWFGWNIKLVDVVKDNTIYLESRESHQQFKATQGLLLTNSTKAVAPGDEEKL